ncbi:hypothetical protein MP228_009417 [Amoeboaphelidium protococcarum]|nr:hypothetical protein MP228_009417 [Amoeboaphelidium protococcarum]
MFSQRQAAMMTLEKLCQTLKQHSLNKSSRLVVLTGAGISTDSGIPDYRGPNGSYTIQKDYKPITYQEFMRSDERRRRYWARSFLGWPRISLARPNSSHIALTALQGLIPFEIFTQNVDGLHLKARSRDVVQMHGTLSEVICQGCLRPFEGGRDAFQLALLDLNPSWSQLLLDATQQYTEYYESHNFLNRSDDDEMHVLHTLGVDRHVQRPNTGLSYKSSVVRPDGDVDLGNLSYANFRYPTCQHCNDNDLHPNRRQYKGIYKPAVVFFGENLEVSVRDHVLRTVGNLQAAQDSLLVIGSSLEVYSAYRIVKIALQKGALVNIINLGATRADKHLDVNKIEMPSSNALKRVLQTIKS